MLIIFCSDPLEPTRVDDCFADQAKAALDVGSRIGVVCLEALVNEHDATRAVRRVKAETACIAFYRGWMVTPSQYRVMWTALREKGITLINSPEAYRYCHWLPEWYGGMAGVSPRSVWLDKDSGLDISQVMEVLRPFAGRPVVLKDYVKSQKHYWREACFIPDSSDRAGVERVVERFLDLQGDDLAGGLVFREYVPLRSLPQHGKSDMPASEEYRVFVLDGHPMLTCNYWEGADYDTQLPDLSQFRKMIRGVPSRFFVMDIARTVDGGWIVVELGDGQVSGLQTANLSEFYTALSLRAP